jgi:hypothetical protein
MKLKDSKNQVLSLINRDAMKKGVSIILDPRSPDGDEGKFVLDGKVSRVANYFSGFHLQVPKTWWEDKSWEAPKVNGTPIDLWIFPLGDYLNGLMAHYHIVDYQKIREFVLDWNYEFSYSGSRNTWMCYIPRITETVGYFKWGSEPKRVYDKLGRFIHLDNIATYKYRNFFINDLGEIAGDDNNNGDKYYESTVENYIKKHPKEFLGENFKFVTQQVALRSGRSRPDLLFKDKNDNYVIVELQINALDEVHLAKTIFRYAISFEMDFGKKPRMILFCNEVREKDKEVVDIYKKTGALDRMIVMSREDTTKLINSLKNDEE